LFEALRRKQDAILDEYLTQKNQHPPLTLISIMLLNIQNYKEKSKAYQVKQVLLALEKLEVNHGITK